MFNLFDEYRILIVSLSLIICIFLTIFAFTKYKRKEHKHLYNIYGFVLMSIGMLSYLIRDIIILTYSNIDNNIIYYYKIPLIVGMIGFILVLIGAHKERSQK